MKIIIDFPFSDESRFSNTTHSTDAMDISDENLLMPIFNAENKAGKNINPRIFFEDPQCKRSCAVCGGKCGIKMVTAHYVRCHPGLEVYTSRLSPKYAARADKEPVPPRLENTTKGANLRTICYFCAEEKSFTPTYWATHVLSHTGEYSSQCDTCNYILLPTQEPHHRAKCVDANFRKRFEYSVTDGYLWAFKCKSCNYVQVICENMEKHLKKEHGYEDQDLSVYYTSIKLISFQMCKPITEVKEEMLEMHDMDDPDANSSPVDAESSNEMAAESASSSQPAGEPTITLQIKSENIRCDDEDVNIGYMQLDQTEELLSSSLCQQLAQEPDSDEEQESDEMSTADIRRVKREQFDGTFDKLRLIFHFIRTGYGGPFDSNFFFCIARIAY